MSTHIDSVVDEVDEDAAFAWLRSGDVRLAVRLWPGIRPGQSVRLRVRVEDVVLCTEVPGKVSTRNVLPGKVVSLRSRPDGVVVVLDVGMPLEALVTRGTVQELGIRVGSKLVALLKATALVPDVAPGGGGGGRVRVSVVGRNDTLDPRRLDLLDAIHGTGSLTAAARERGISYRTAWLWVEQMQRAWGEPLVATVKGGAGGGGALLTLEGHAVLQLARRHEGLD